MNAGLVEFLSHHQPVAEEMAIWGNGRLPFRITAYLAADLPLLEYVTSVRAIVLRDNSVLTVRDAENTFHILPGRREEGERVETTLAREVLEETGWTIHAPSLIGILHLRHLAPRPADYVYPYPDLLQLVYWARAGEFMPWHRNQGEYEIESGFRSIDQVTTLGLPVSQQVFLVAARAAAREET